MTSNQNENHALMSNALGSSTQVEVVMVPLPAQGHLNQLLHLSGLIAARGIPVHYIAAATHVRQAKLRVHGWNPNSSKSIRFHEISVPPSLSPAPNPAGPHKFPSHLLPSLYASTHYLHRPVSDLIHELSLKSRRVVVVHDSLMTSTVQAIAEVPNAEAYTFHSVSGFAVFMYFWEMIENPFKEEAMKIIPKDVPSQEGCFPEDFVKFIDEQHRFQSNTSGNILNSTRAIEKPYLDLMDRILKGNKSWAIGPFSPVDKPMSKDRHKCLHWLDRQSPRSVLYVSFGTTTTFTTEQIEELAKGLEQSGQKFIWVLRVADRGDVFGREEAIELPIGFEERVKEMGLVIRDWAPQTAILGHEATGGFLSHCGWNSCTESITAGVPIGTWPMHSDQPRNTVLVTQVLRVGIVVGEWRNREKVVSAAQICDGVRRLMASEEGDNARKRAVELGCAVRRSVAEGGVSRLELDSFIAHIAR